MTVGLFGGAAAHAQSIDLGNVLLQVCGTASGRIVQLVVLLTALSIAPGLLVMAPTFDCAYDGGLRPLLDGEIAETEAYAKISGPFRAFMLGQVRDKDLKLFDDLAPASIKLAAAPADRGTVDLHVLIPAFMISEIRRGFDIVFLITLPVLPIDMGVPTITMSMGMMMLPPSVILLPQKVLFFVLIDGWNMLVGSLIRSYS